MARRRWLVDTRGTTAADKPEPPAVATRALRRSLLALVRTAVIKGAKPYVCIQALDGVRSTLEQLDWGRKSRHQVSADLDKLLDD